MLKKLIDILGDLNQRTNKEEYSNVTSVKKFIQWLYSIVSILLMLITIALLLLILCNIIRLFNYPLDEVILDILKAYIIIN